MIANKTYKVNRFSNLRIPSLASPSILEYPFNNSTTAKFIRAYGRFEVWRAADGRFAVLEPKTATLCTQTDAHRRALESLYAERQGRSVVILQTATFAFRVCHSHARTKTKLEAQILTMGLQNQIIEPGA